MECEAVNLKVRSSSLLGSDVYSLEECLWETIVTFWGGQAAKMMMKTAAHLHLHYAMRTAMRVQEYV